VWKDRCRSWPRIESVRWISLLCVLFAIAAAIVVHNLTAARAGGTPVALVTAETENSLLAISLPDGRVLRRVALPADPENVVAGVGVTAVVVSARGHAVSLLDWRSLKRIKVLRDFGAPHLAVVAPDGEWAYVSDDARGELVTIELSSKRVVDRLAVGAGAHHLTISPDGRRLWLALGEQARTLVIVDTSRHDHPRTVRRFDPGFAVHDLAFSPDGRQVWLSSATSRSVTVVEARGPRPEARGPRPEARGARRLFTVPAGRPPQHVAFNDQVSTLRRFAYITSGYSGRIEMVDSHSGRILRSARVPYGSFNLTTAGGLVVASSLTNGTLTELTDQLHVIRSLKVAPAARDVGVIIW
jgi:DNA-binding beta-propeller fold protein YncE